MKVDGFHPDWLFFIYENKLYYELNQMPVEQEEENGHDSGKSLTETFAKIYKLLHYICNSTT